MPAGGNFRHAGGEKQSEASQVPGIVGAAGGGKKNPSAMTGWCGAGHSTGEPHGA